MQTACDYPSLCEETVVRPSRVIVIRGDLYSDTGYARATRALKEVLAKHAARVFGVSLHEHRHRRQNAIDIPVVHDVDLRENQAFRDALIVNVCLPDQFIRVAGAFNVGYFFWETDATPSERFWKAQMMTMDRLWAPSRWQSAHLAALCGGGTEVPVIPWPLASDMPLRGASMATLSKVRTHRVMTTAELDNHLLRVAPSDERMREKELEAEDHRDGRSARFDPTNSPTFECLHKAPGDLFVAVQTDAPRKGLPLLLANWMQFKASETGRDAKLVVKISSLDVHADLVHLHFHTSLAVRKAARRCRIEHADVWFIYDRLSADEMRALLGVADAFITATMGEGFGGPIAEALVEGTPVLAPRHTAIQDVLDADYPLAIASTPHALNLWNNIDVYSPASQWHVVDDASFQERLQTFARMPEVTRRAIAESARRALLDRVGCAAVGKTLRDEIDLCTALSRARATTHRPLLLQGRRNVGSCPSVDADASRRQVSLNGSDRHA